MVLGNPFFLKSLSSWDEGGVLEVTDRKDLCKFCWDKRQLRHKEDLIVISKFSLEETTSNDSYKNLPKIIINVNLN